jgi:hypothetical protein
MVKRPGGLPFCHPMDGGIMRIGNTYDGKVGTIVPAMLAARVEATP